jgi:hypothetical protein
VLVVSLSSSVEVGELLKLAALDGVVSSVEPSLGANVKVGITKVVLFGQIANPSVMHGALDAEHTREGCVERGALEVELMVWVTVMTTAVVIFVIVGAVESSSCGRVNTLASRNGRIRAEYRRIIVKS